MLFHPTPLASHLNLTTKEADETKILCWGKLDEKSASPAEAQFLLHLSSDFKETLQDAFEM